ncbi:FAD-binding oxidoreductase [Paenarthrobacter aurescens]|uniref:FAD-linked oxidase n=1 Tax=Paenarthrobacter aurescens TaxID=43663 RepID=A0A4Y3NJX1_PAEAU|nr:FAD-binding protein [Paenarthrobacter aurescens]MDO6142487.1 FAD-binding protein [Paenarthrobacter aurescens]MDO6146334.1 FAD-binding protein [Paenarthrobacter aurescens]MDO6157579.1 FAD-binding protein [Paenarthrobacter aurescens]MDO6161564.1 FAD-binding protein [Paenarthrobacter aurescens]GEB20755.1 FAD-linked oxidase [Paenarthrobacter aurescens]
MSDETAVAGTSEESIKARAVDAGETAQPTAAQHAFLRDLQAGLGTGQTAVDQENLTVYSADQGPILERKLPLAVVWAESVEDVQHVVRVCAAHQVPIVPRGAGTGVSGGAHATQGCIILSLERMTRILDLNPDDETAVVEPGVINADLNAAAAEHGLMYAPDPASYKMSTIGGNVATNAGGLRCAKYGVTRDSVLALDVVMADGSLMHTGHQTFKGVAGYDLTALLVGSEGTLGIVVGVTVRLKYLPREVHTIAAFYQDFRSAAAGVLAVGKARVQPAIMELLDNGTLVQLDELHGGDLQQRGKSLLLIQTDGFGAAAEADVVRQVLADGGATVTTEASAEAEMLVEMRRNSRGVEVDDEFRVGEDIAVPRSRLVDFVAELEAMANRFQVRLKVVAHAGDGNLHPTFWMDRVDPTTDAHALQRLNAALDESIRVGLDMGGTITGEHGVGQYKLRWLGLEQPQPVRELQRRIKELFDPQGILNPGKAI